MRACRPTFTGEESTPRALVKFGTPTFPFWPHEWRVDLVLFGRFRRHAGSSPPRWRRIADDGIVADRTLLLRRGALPMR
jgi:hypothetical protein